MPPPTTNNLWQTLTNKNQLFLIAGPCVIESQDLCYNIAAKLKRTTQALKIPLIFKASYDKANRTSAASFRGPGIHAGLTILQHIKTKLNLPLLTDIHTETEAQQAAPIIDILQIPAFLSRQTNLLQTAAKTKRIINIKKGQFASPHDMRPLLNKLTTTNNHRILLTERGVTFGYHNLIVDMRSIPIMQQLGCPVIFDATHSVQLPGASGNKSDGQNQYAPTLAKAAIAAGANGIYIETHPNPEQALSDGPNMIPLKNLPQLLKQLLAIHHAIH